MLVLLQGRAGQPGSQAAFLVSSREAEAAEAAAAGQGQRLQGQRLQGQQKKMPE